MRIVLLVPLYKNIYKDFLILSFVKSQQKIIYLSIVY